VLAGKVILSARDSLDGYEPWISDGTVAGTGKLADVEPATADSSPEPIASMGSTVYYSIVDAQHGRELWRTDGTGAGTSLVADINPGAAGSSPGPGTVVGSRVFFTASNAASGRELWVTDGTPAGTMRLTELGPGAADGDLSHPAAFNGQLYFRADPGNTGANRLWRSDGTVAGTGLVLPDHELEGDANLIAFGGRLLFFGTLGTTDGVWSTSGMPTDVVYLAHALRGGHPSTTVVGSRLYFTAQPYEENVVHGTSVWVTDGTPTGTRPVDFGAQDAHRDPSELTAFKNKVAFAANGNAGPLQDPAFANYEPWVTDGTAGGTVKLKDVNSKGSSSPHSFTVANGTLFFAATHVTSGEELWRSSGTPSGTAIVKNIAAGDAGAVDHLTESGGALYFEAYQPASGDELWQSNGTGTGTRLALDLNPGSGSSRISSITALGGSLLLTADDGVSGLELWRVEP
jgi:ELWxxDGT repeat protein